MVIQKLLVIQHEKDTPAGTTLEWAEQKNIETTFWYPASEPQPPGIEAVVGVVICGGSMDIHEEQKHPWLKTEKNFIRELIEKKVPVFGLCLGSQLLAEVLGGKVFQHPGWEIGFVPAKSSEGDDVPMFHWHRYTFDLPPGAQRLIEGTYCRNQAFQWGSHIMATQFHPEATESWIQECAEEVGPQHQGLVQKKEEMLKALPLQKKLQSWYFKKLDQLFLKT